MLTIHFSGKDILWQYTNGDIFIEGTADDIDAIIATIEYTFQWLGE